MQIVFQAHHAQVSEPMRERARRAVQKAAQRINRAVNAIVRFEEDGPTRRVEIVVRAPRQRPIVAEGRGRFFGAALATAIARLHRQAAGAKHSRKASGNGRPAGVPPRVRDIDIADLAAGDLRPLAVGRGGIANA